MRKKRPISVLAVIIYAVYVSLAVLSVLPFWIMFMSATRSTTEIQQRAIIFLPSTHVMKNLEVLLEKSFNPTVGFMNSLLISVGTTACVVYFSTMTACGLIMYSWRFQEPFFSLIMAIMMISAQMTMVGSYQVAYRIHMTNHLAVLILPTIASPSMVFSMRQYMLPALSMEIIQAAHIDGARKFYTFSRIALLIMKSAITTQAIFSFVTGWNNLSTPLVLLTDKNKYTIPIMINLLRDDVYKTEYGSVCLELVLTVLPLVMMYLLLSRYIIADVALDGVKR